MANFIHAYINMSVSVFLGMEIEKRLGALEESKTK